MNKKEAGQVIFQAIKDYLRTQGASMDVDKFPKDFPVSYRTVYHIAKGQWTDKLLTKLPFDIRVKYTVVIGKGKPRNPERNRKIIEQYHTGKSVKEIAELFNVTIPSAWHVIQRYAKKRDKHLAKIGQNSNRSKLTDNQILKILIDYNENYLSVKELSGKYNIHETHVRGLIKGLSRTDNAEIEAYRKEKLIIRDERKSFVRPVATKKK